MFLPPSIQPDGAALRRLKNVRACVVHDVSACHALRVTQLFPVSKHNNVPGEVAFRNMLRQALLSASTNILVARPSGAAVILYLVRQVFTRQRRHVAAAVCVAIVCVIVGRLLNYTTQCDETASCSVQPAVL